MKLTEFIHVEAHTSPLAVVCNACMATINAPAKYAKVSVKKTVIVNTPSDGGIPFEVEATLAVCRLCFGEFVYQAIKTERAVQP